MSQRVSFHSGGRNHPRRGGKKAAGATKSLDDSKSNQNKADIVFGSGSTAKSRDESTMSFSSYILARVTMAGDTTEQQMRKKTVLVLNSVLLCCGFCWGLLYFGLGVGLAALSCAFYCITVFAATVLFISQRIMFESYVYTSLVMIFSVPFCVNIVFGGYVEASFVFNWCSIAVLGSFAFCRDQFFHWIIVYVVANIFNTIYSSFSVHENTYQVSSIMASFFLFMNTVGPFCATLAVLWVISNELGDARSKIDTMATEMMDLLGSTQEILPCDIVISKKIGAGSSAIVYSGKWRGADVAIKKLNIGGNIEGSKEDLMDDVWSETRIMCEMQHPNIVRLLGAMNTTDSLCVVSELCTRGSLFDILHDSRVDISKELMWHIIRGAAAGLSYLHSKGIVHRDFKSQNLLVCLDWTIKVSDFGLSKLLDKQADVGSVMSICGTPAWCAPEVMRHEDYDQSADVYSFGIVLWEVVSRMVPFAGLSVFDIMKKVVIEGNRPDIDLIKDPYIAHVIQACWHEDPFKRPTMDVVICLLEDKDCNETDINIHTGESIRKSRSEIFHDKSPRPSKESRMRSNSVDNPNPVDWLSLTEDGGGGGKEEKVAIRVSPPNEDHNNAQSSGNSWLDF